LVGRSGIAKYPQTAIGILIMASKMKSHLHPASPALPFRPPWIPAWRYPLNIDAIALDCSNSDTLLESWVGLYQVPRRAA
jgi:hypothetical protein